MYIYIYIQVNRLTVGGKQTMTRNTAATSSINKIFRSIPHQVRYMDILALTQETTIHKQLVRKSSCQYKTTIYNTDTMRPTTPAILDYTPKTTLEY